jgi:phytoene/squalene synthetase
MQKPDNGGKSEATENFPVVRFLAPDKRERALHFYRLARQADDIADDPQLAPEDKLHRLDIVAASEPDDAHLAQLLQAFRWDVNKRRYRDWSELMLYCRFSAAPVGHFLLALHGESRKAHPAADALCAALQVLNHLQDCGDDYRRLDRVYLPTAWLEAEGAAVTDLAAGAASPALRRVFDQALDRVNELLVHARPLGAAIADRRLRLQAEITLAVGVRLARLLRRRDPLAARVRLSGLGHGLAVTAGAWHWLSGR